jgi:hypothetical protein
MTDLSRSQQKRVDATFRSIEDMRLDLQGITRTILSELIYRGDMTAGHDGYTSNKRPKIGGSSSKSTPTEVMALQGLYGDTEGDDRSDRWELHEVQDEQGEAIETLLVLLNFMFKASKRVKKLSTFVHHVGDSERGRQDATTQCEFCGGPVAGTQADPLRRGMGSVCAQRYYAMARKHSAKYQRALDVQVWWSDESQAIENGERRKCGDTVSVVRAKARVIPGSKGFYEVDDLDAIQAARVLPRGRS